MRSIRPAKPAIKLNVQAIAFEALVGDRANLSVTTVEQETYSLSVQSDQLARFIAETARVVFSGLGGANAEH